MNTIHSFGARLAVIVVAIGLLFAVSANCSAAIVISDATFNNADWELTVITIGSGGTVTATQALTGGNPGAYRHITNTVNPAPPDGPGSVLGLHRFLPATYDPAAQGAILSLDYSEDSKMFSGFGAGQPFRVALWQDGETYLSIQRLFANQSDWTTQGLLGLTQNDFFLLFPDGDTDVNQHPNFSSVGAPIGFGFERDDSTPIGGIGYTIVAGIDNWSITLTSVTAAAAVPEPGSLTFFGLGAFSVAYAAFRRRSRGSLRS